MGLFCRPPAASLPRRLNRTRRKPAFLHTPPTANDIEFTAKYATAPGLYLRIAERHNNGYALAGISGTPTKSGLVHSFGRANQIDRTVLGRSVKSIDRALETDAVTPGSEIAEIEFNRASWACRCPPVRCGRRGHRPGRANGRGYPAARPADRGGLAPQLVSRSSPQENQSRARSLPQSRMPSLLGKRGISL